LPTPDLSLLASTPDPPTILKKNPKWRKILVEGFMSEINQTAI
jgi:hypothetical protein